MPSLAIEDREERRFLTIEDNAAGAPQRTCFAESSAERSRRLAVSQEWVTPHFNDPLPGQIFLGMSDPQSFLPRKK